MGQSLRVVVAMSGGVDSAVAAALLAEAGYDVVGITLRLSPDPEKGGGAESGRPDSCCSPKDVEDARRVAEQVGISFYALDYEREFAREVIDHFAGEYMRGRTPNPCIPCNFRLKFGSLLARAAGWGATHVATGHYARVRFDESRGRYLLLRGVDPEKDQSYVLYNLTQEQLKRAILPLGRLRKQEVRAAAAVRHLPVATKPDSQEICFVRTSYKDFLQERWGDRFLPGLIRDQGGRVLGEHGGIALYTIGQRSGLGIGGGGPYYVTRLDAERNEVWVGRKEDLLTREILVEELNWIAVASLAEPLTVGVVCRYHQRPMGATLTPLGEERVRVTFAEPQVRPAPGQAAVFYDTDDPDLVLGGGTVAAG